MLKFKVYGNPATKKNNGRIIKIKHGKRKGKYALIPSEKYEQYEKNFVRQIVGNLRQEIDYPVNVKAIYYRATKHRVDISNLHSALHDCLVKAKVLKDDNYKIIASTDGSRVRFDRDNPRVEVEIEKEYER